MSNVAADTPRDVLDSFIDALDDNLDTHDLERVLAGDRTTTIADLGNEPEAWVEENLIWPLISAVGLNREPGRPASQHDTPTGQQREHPDFRLIEEDGDVTVVGENKSLNNVEDAEEELVDEYLSRKAWSDYGIATDGIDWVVYRAERGGDFLAFDDVRRVSLRNAMQEIAREKGYIGTGAVEDVDVGEDLDAFEAVFKPENLIRILREEAPQEFRDERQRSIEDFYALYIELLFGESSAYDYETSLLDDIVSPPGADEHDERLFAVTTVNRLLFIKFLEDRGVLDEGFLRARVADYEEHGEDLPGTLYETVVKPLFYDLFNSDDRHPKHETGWFDDVPYLNGGLFTATIQSEKEYNILDRTLPVVITDLIEGSELGAEDDNGAAIDPAVLGSVFEKTINHIGEQEGRQKDIGAYYTPNDVTRLITEQTVDPKVEDVLVEAFVEEGAADEDDDTREYIRSTLRDDGLADMLKYIEDGAGIYGANPAAMETALERITNLTILDPACGSGHFLTSVLEELHQVQLSLLRGLNGGDEPSDRRKYEVKQELALNAIYGADVDDIAVEIAKLRVWLKIVEGNGWQEQYGRLPNIDVNVVVGNSLIGMPVTGGSQMQLGALDDRIGELAVRRYRLKHRNEGDRASIRDLEREVREDRDDKYLQHLGYTVTRDISGVAEFDALVDVVDDDVVVPQLAGVRFERDDGESFTDEQEDRLEDAGARVWSKSAWLDFESRISDDAGSQSDATRRLLRDVRDLCDGELTVTEVERQPLRSDLDAITGTPLHWDVEFPEVIVDDDTLDAAEDPGEVAVNGADVEFDVVIGNPPYGDLLNGHEEMFTAPYTTSDIPEIAAQFVERQLDLLAPDGYFGNVTTLRLVYQSSIEEFHDLLRRRLSESRVASFGTRPSRVFENADIKVAIITGQHDDDTEDDSGTLKTSDMLLFAEESREETFSDIQYSSTEGCVLRDKIGGDEGSRAVLPKIGPEQKREILESLKADSDTVFSDVYERDPDDPDDMYSVWRREGVRYFTNVMRDELYSAREVMPMYFESELQRDAAFITLNSSLFFAYWVTYGNTHHLNWTQISAFPFPDEDGIEARADEVSELADSLWEGMQECFDADAGVTGEFHSSRLKPVIDEVDEVLGEVYGFDDDVVEYLQGYMTDLGEESGRSAPADADVTEF